MIRITNTKYLILYIIKTSYYYGGGYSQRF
jgi:hypothetical protein